MGGGDFCWFALIGLNMMTSCVPIYNIFAKRDPKAKAKEGPGRTPSYLLPHFLRISPLDLGLELDEAAIYSGGLSFLCYGRKEDIYYRVFIKQIYECALAFPFLSISISIAIALWVDTHVNGHLRLD